MPVSECHIQTVNAAVYIKKLCKHFAHKIEVSYRDGVAQCQFPTGTATMKAIGGVLTFEVFAESVDALETGKFIIEDHFMRFSKKENFEKLTWIDT